MRDNSYKSDKPVTIDESVKRKLVKRRANTAPVVNGWDLIQKISAGRAGVATDAKAIREILPDVKLVENLIMDSILAPNDLTSITPRFILDGTRYSDSPVVTKINELIEEHFTSSHKIVPKLKSYLKDILFDYGSHTLIVLPENSIDEIINGQEAPGMEDIEKISKSIKEKLIDNIGLLGSGLDFNKPFKNQKGNGLGIENFGGVNSYSTEAKMNDLNYSVHDNPMLLNVPNMRSLARSIVVKDRLKKVGLESFALGGGYRSPYKSSVGEGSISQDISLLSPEERKKLDSMYKESPMQLKEVVNVKPQSKLERKTVGHPVVIEPTADAVIVAHVPGKLGNILGAFLVLDENGNPISLPTEVTRYNNMANLYAKDGESGSNSDSDASMSIRQSFTKMYGVQSDSSARTIEQLTEMHSQLVVDDLNQRLADGIYGRTVELAAHENIFKVMLARHLSNIGTRLLWIPESLMTYMAVDYNKDGTGRSLTEDIKIVASYRSIVMMATVLGAINSSVNKTKIRIQLDEEDAEPQDTVMKILGEYIQTQANLPLNSNSYMDQLTYLQASSVSVEVDGNPNYIETKVDLEDSQRNQSNPNEELNEMLRKMHLSGYGVTIEQLDQLLTSDTATAVKAATANFTKSVQNIRHLFNECVSDHVRKYVANSQPLRDEIISILTENKDTMPTELAEAIKTHNGEAELVVNELIRDIIFELPDGDHEVTEAQVQAFEQHMTLVEKVAEVHFSSESLTSFGMGEQAAELVDQMRAAFISSEARNWLRSNGINNFDDLIYGDVDDSTLDKVHLAYMERVSKIIRNMAAGTKRIRAENEKLLNEENADLDNVGGFGGGGGSSFGGDSGGGGDDGFGGGDDFGFDEGGDDFGSDMGDDITADDGEEPPEEDTSGGDELGAF